MGNDHTVGRRHADGCGSFHDSRLRSRLVAAVAVFPLGMIGIEIAGVMRGVRLWTPIVVAVEKKVLP